MEKYRVKPNSSVNLSHWDPNDDSLIDGGKDEGKDALKPLNRRLEELQELLYAQRKEKILIVLQAIRLPASKSPLILSWPMTICGASINICLPVARWLSSTAATMRMCW